MSIATVGSFPTFSPISPHQVQQPKFSPSSQIFASPQLEGKTEGRKERKHASRCWTGGKTACWLLVCFDGAVFSTAFGLLWRYCQLWASFFYGFCKCLSNCLTHFYSSYFMCLCICVESVSSLCRKTLYALVFKYSEKRPLQPFIFRQNRYTIRSCQMIYGSHNWGDSFIIANLFGGGLRSRSGCRDLVIP